MPKERDWKSKLHPQRFPGMTPQFMAIVGYILDETYTDPSIDEIVVTSDRHVLAQHAGDIGLNVFLGPASVLERNWITLLAVAGLTPEEKVEANKAYKAHIFGAASPEAYVHEGKLIEKKARARRLVN